MLSNFSVSSALSRPFGIIFDLLFSVSAEEGTGEQCEAETKGAPPGDRGTGFASAINEAYL